MKKIIVIYIISAIIVSGLGVIGTQNDNNIIESTIQISSDEELLKCK